MLRSQPTNPGVTVGQMRAEDEQLAAMFPVPEDVEFGESTWAPIRNGRLDLGTWERLFLVELFEPRRRTVDVAVRGE